MIRTFKNKRSAKSDGLLGEGGQDPRNEKREPREGEGEEGIECTSAMRNRQMRLCGAPPAMKDGEPDPHTYPAPALARRARTVQKGLSEHRELTHATTKRKEGKPHIHYYTEIW